MIDLTTAAKLHPYNDLPSMLTSSVKDCPYDPSISGRVRSSPIGKKFGEISLHFLQRPTSDPFHTLEQTIRDRLIELGLYVGKISSSRYRTLADLAADLLPRPWLIYHFSSGYSRGPNSFVGHLNKTVGHRGSPGVEHYALAQAILATH
jgi:hypothetical protein